MSARRPLAALDALGQREKLELPSERFGLPFVLEYDLAIFSRLYGPEIRAAFAEADAQVRSGGGAQALAARGRCRRLLGDPSGALADLNAALDADPRLAVAHAWLGELGLGGASAEASLSRALELDPAAHHARLYRGAARLLRGDAAGAAQDLQAASRARGAGALAPLLLGAARRRQGRSADALRAFALAARRAPECSGAHMLQSREERSPARAARAGERALTAEPTYALIALQGFRPAASARWPAYLKRLRAFAFAEPQRAAWYYRQEDIHYSPYQFQEYEDSCRVLAARPRSPWAMGLVSRGALRCPPDEGRLARGLSVLEEAARLAPRSGWLYAWRALAKIKGRRLPEALADLDRCVRLQPYYHRAYAWRGALLRQMGRVKDALADLERAIAVDEQYPFAVHERSLARRAAGDFAGAALDLDRAFRLDFRYSWVFTAGREPRREELERAAAELAAALERSPRLPSLRVWRADVLLRLGRRPEAMLELARARRLEPGHALAHAWHGRALAEEGRAAEGAPLLARAVALEPTTWIFHGWLAEAQRQAGRPREALATLDALASAKPDQWWPIHMRAELHLAEGRPDRAERDAARALRFEGRHADGYYTLARAQLALGRLAAAGRSVERALAVSPHLGRAYLLRAEISRRRGDAGRTLSDYGVVYEKFPYLFNEEQRAEVERLLKR